MNNELKKIKKLYGEEMMHLCRELFPSVLETEGLLLSILEKNIAPTHSFASDIKESDNINDFKNWINSIFFSKNIVNAINTGKTPFELMDEAGYILYECKTEEDIQKFRKYYARGEEICTFNGARLNNCHVFFAVKKNVDKIKRKNFPNPQRQDEYGTSVISIQFSKSKPNILSIKNRYNHTVCNPDATYSNFLDNIVPGLTKSFEKYYGYDITIPKDSIMPHFLHSYNSLKYRKSNDERYYRFNICAEDIYFCENNIIIDYTILKTKYHDNPERYILMDNIIVDLKNKTFNEYRRPASSFVKSINDVGTIKKIEVIKEDKIKKIIVIYEDNKKVVIKIDKNNSIIEYVNNYIEKIDSDFLYYNVNLEKISLPKVKSINNSFLCYNRNLKKINLPKVEKIGCHFLSNNKKLKSIQFPEAESIDSGFMYCNHIINRVSLPKVKRIGMSFLEDNTKLKSISLPEVEIVWYGFLKSNTKISELYMPKIRLAGDYFLHCNKGLTELLLPEIEKMGAHSLYQNNKLNKIYMPKLKEIGEYSMNNLNKTTCEKNIGKIKVLERK